jgi:uncharacterized protein
MASHAHSDQVPASAPITGWAALRLVALPAAATILLITGLRVGGEPGVALQSFSTRFLGIFIEAVPFLLVGTLVSGFLEVFLDRGALTRLVPRQPVLAAACGVGLGFVFPVCECGVVPVTRRLFTKGLPVSVGIAFLLASPVMNPIVVASTAAAFGWGPVLWGRLLLTALIALGVGLVFSLRGAGVTSVRPSALPAVSGAASDLSLTQPPLGVRIRLALDLAMDEFFEMGRYLVVGGLLAATLQTLVPQDALVALGRGPVTSVVAMELLAYLLSVCSTVDAFLALAFTGTFTTGSILAFLTFGPMVDVKSTLMFLSVFRPRTVAYLVLLPVALALVAGVWINLNLAL